VLSETCHSSLHHSVHSDQCRSHIRSPEITCDVKALIHNFIEIFEFVLIVKRADGEFYHCIRLLIADPSGARSKVWVFGLSFAGIVASNPTGGMDILCIVCSQAEVSALGWSLVQRSPV
jgi:hypothetical protein